jgi:hypothetical protein
MSEGNNSPQAETSKRKQLLIERVVGGDPVPIEDWLEIHVDRIDDQTIAIGGLHRPEGGYRSQLTIAGWTDWEEAKEIGRTLSDHASLVRLLFNRPKCFLVIDDDA